MRKVSLIALMLAPIAANAAGTYYSGYTNAYQSPQTGYSTQTYAQRQGGYANQYNRYAAPSYASTRYNTGSVANTATMAQQSNTQAKSNNSKKTGFWLDAGISHEMAQWQFEMAQSGSILSYDNVGWNVFDITAGYAFDVGSTTLQFDAGFKYGMQWGESTMYDDDISNGGFLVTTWVDAGDKSTIGDQIGHAMSIGTSKGGNMLGFNVGFGLTDIFKIGNVTITPSVGYRYLKYKLTTENNFGLSVDTTACFQVEGSDEIQCDPAIIVNLGDGKQQIIWRDDINGSMDIPSGATDINTGSTYYYHQPGTSHSYETTWAGPYIALDMDYVINQYNAVNGRVEFGFPGYTSTGDQPYRFDWAHPKSVEDEAGMFGAFHFGLGANWTTSITDYVALSVGLTYDYYTVSGADASTYLNMDYYNTWYNMILDAWKEQYPDNTEDYMLGKIEDVAGDPTAINIKNLEAQCPGGVCTTDSEIESFYKSLGIRIGINAKF